MFLLLPEIRKTWTGWLKERGITVVHVVSSLRFAVKCEEAGVDAVVAEGFEAGGHNGREENNNFLSVPAVREATTLPLIAAGGIGTGEGILAAWSWELKECRWEPVLL